MPALGGEPCSERRAEKGKDCLCLLVGEEDKPGWKGPREVLSSSPAGVAVSEAIRQSKLKAGRWGTACCRTLHVLKNIHKFKNYWRRLQKRAMLMTPTTETPALAQPVLMASRIRSALLIPRHPGLATPRG